MNEPPNPEVAVFAAALEMPADQRDAYLDQACAGNAALRRQVEALLRVHDDAGNFFDKLVPLARPTSAEEAMPGPNATNRLPGIPSEKPGDRIGRYKLLQQIGEGGCGVVYMAEQEEPVRRRVALKVIKLGMDTKSVIARFEAERQALALMEHPNIAKVLDAGATENGRPFFVMELVRGIKITDYCDQNNLSTEARLELFVLVCQAVQHAHQKGIIHRDIKPSNILVTLNDGVAVPKVIDFGIAKATQGRLTDHTLFTAFEQFLGTPAYMSPEQAEMTSLDVDTRSDIYSLGVLLYELLTSQTPFDAKELLQAGLDEIRRTIREQEPARPSTRLSTMLGADLTLIAKHRKAEPPKLIHLLRGDLDWIVMKALEKDRTRRYETANGLAADIERHLKNEPVVACPPSNFYRFQKMVRRNKGPFLAAAGIVLILLISAAISGWQAIRAFRAERSAQTEAQESQQIASFLMKTLGNSIAWSQDGNTNFLAVYIPRDNFATVEGMFHKVELLRRRRFGNESPEVAQVLNTIAMVREQAGDWAGAEASWRESVAIMKHACGEQSEQVGETLFNLGYFLDRRGNRTEADRTFRQAINIVTTNYIAWCEGGGLKQTTPSWPQPPDYIQSYPNGVLKHAAYRANLNASFYFWNEAASDLALTVELAPNENVHYYLLAPILIKKKDLSGYHKLSKSMVDEFMHTQDWQEAERTARTCILLPNSSTDLRAADNLADVALADCGQEPNSVARCEFTKALAQYRLGDYRAAVEWAGKSLAHKPTAYDSWNPSREIEAHALEAMAYYRLNELEDARSSLKRTSEFVRRDSPRRLGIRDTLLADLLTCDILMDEAKALIEGPSAAALPK